MLNTIIGRLTLVSEGKDPYYDGVTGEFDTVDIDAGLFTVHLDDVYTVVVELTPDGVQVTIEDPEGNDEGSESVDLGPKLDVLQYTRHDDGHYEFVLRDYHGKEFTVDITTTDVYVQMPDGTTREILYENV